MTLCLSLFAPATSACAETRQPLGQIAPLRTITASNGATNALALGFRLFVNAAAFSYWIAHPGAATHLFG